jgi:hypothetical protein
LNQFISKAFIFVLSCGSIIVGYNIGGFFGVIVGLGLSILIAYLADNFITETTVVNNGGSNQMVKYGDSSSSFDINEQSIASLYNKLHSSINSQEPLFIFSKGKRIENIRLDNEYQGEILSKIESLIALSNSYSRLKADAIFNQEYIYNLVMNNKAEANRKFEIAIKLHEVEISNMDKAIKINDNEVNSGIAQYESLRAENNIKEANARKILAEAEDIKARAADRNLVIQSTVSVFNTIATGLDMNNISTAQAFVLSSLFGKNNSNPVDDFDSKKAMNDEMVNGMKQETAKKKAEAEDKELDNKNKKLNYERNAGKKFDEEEV